MATIISRLMKAIMPIPSTALNNVSAITPRKGQRNWRKTTLNNVMQAIHQLKNSLQCNGMPNDSNSYSHHAITGVAGQKARRNVRL